MISLTPNAHLLASLRPDGIEIIDSTVSIPDLDISSSPFLQLRTVSVALDFTNEQPLSLSFRSCDHMKHAYLADIYRPPIGFSIRSAWHLLLGSYIVSLNNVPVFMLDDIQHLLSSLQVSEHVPATIEVVLAPDCSSLFDDRAPPLHLCLHDLHHVHALQSIAREGIACGITDILFNELPPPASLCSLIKSMEASFCDIDMACMVYRLQTSGMTDEERLLKCFTWHQLKHLKN